MPCSLLVVLEVASQQNASPEVDKVGRMLRGGSAYAYLAESSIDLRLLPQTPA